jgi:hypothetical protein
MNRYTLHEQAGLPVVWAKAGDTLRTTGAAQTIAPTAAPRLISSRRRIFAGSFRPSVTTFLSEKRKARGNCRF